MGQVDMRKEIILRKVKAKLIQKEVEAGAKDWISGIGVTLLSLFGGMDNASATAKDVDKYLSKIQPQIEKLNQKFNYDAEFKKTFKRLRYDTDISPSTSGEMPEWEPVYKGEGAFNFKVGPYTISGDYHDFIYKDGEPTRSDKVKFESDVKKDSNASKEDLEKWRNYAYEIQDELKEQFNQKKY